MNKKNYNKYDLSNVDEVYMEEMDYIQIKDKFHFKKLKIFNDFTRYEKYDKKTKYNLGLFEYNNLENRCLEAIKIFNLLNKKNNNLKLFLYTNQEEQIVDLDNINNFKELNKLIVQNKNIIIINSRNPKDFFQKLII